MKQIRHIGVIGEGKMGTSLFFFLGGFDFRLTWLASSRDEAERARKNFLNKAGFLLRSGALTAAAYDLKTGMTSVTDSPDDLHDCDLVIEAITEDRSRKKALFSRLDRTINEDCIFASNSSSILPSELLPSENRATRFCGLHFFFPVALKSVVELITLPATSRQTKELLLQFLASIGKIPLQQNEENAFLLNRLFLDMQAGAYRIFLEGRLSYRDIDDLVKKHIFLAGIFEFFDHVGIDVMLASVKSYTRDSKNIALYAPLLDKMEELVKQNRLGIKTKQGFYGYPPQEDPAGGSTGIKGSGEAYKQTVIRQLWNYYIRSVEEVLAGGLYSRKELAFAINDYAGTDADPFTAPMQE